MNKEEQHQQLFEVFKRLSNTPQVDINDLICLAFHCGLDINEVLNEGGVQ
jgi:hypothetical protein